MAIATVKADHEILDIIAGSEMDEAGITLKGQLDRIQYEAVNKFLELTGAKWNRSAKRHIFQPGAKVKLEALLGSGEIVNEKKQFQAFYTPSWLAEELVAMGGVGEGMDCLEPSAGAGAIAIAARKAGGKVWCIEINQEAVKELVSLGFAPNTLDFLTLKPTDAPEFDRVLMNPPFSNDQDIKHVMHAFRFLKPGGKLYAIMSPGFTFGSQRNIRKEFSQMVSVYGRVVRTLPSGTFRESGTDVTTVIVELTKMV